MGEGGVRVKICGLVRREDAVFADEAGADYLGVVLTPGFGRSVDPARAAELVEGTRARKVGVLVDASPDAAELAGRAIGADVLQLHGDESPDVLQELHARGPWALWKAVRAGSLGDVERAVQRYAHLADGLLVEGLQEGSLGVGGARVELDPGSVRKLVPLSIDFVLAGGLGAKTVRDAVGRFLPDVVDVSSGVEATLGKKDHALVRAFIDGARSAGETSAMGRGR